MGNFIGYWSIGIIKYGLDYLDPSNLFYWPVLQTRSIRRIKPRAMLLLPNSVESMLASHFPVSVEPMLALYYTAAAVSTFTSTNLLILKVCSPDTLPYVGQPCDEVVAQKVVSGINAWKPSIEYSLPVVFMLFAATWSDTHGRRRRPLMVLPVAGELVALLFLGTNVYFWRWPPAVAALGEAVLRGLTGGRTLFSVGAVTYLAEHTLPEQRTFRLAVVTAIIFISTPIGNAVAGVMRVSYGFYYVYSFCLALNLLALLAGLSLISNPDPTSPDTPEASCGPRHLAAVWRAVFRRRTGHGRLVLLLMVVVSPIFGGCLLGEYSTLYLYTRYQFGWGETDYGFYSSYRLSITFLGTLVSVFLLSKALKFSDSIIGLMASVMQALVATGSAFATQPWQLFALPAADLMHGAIYTVGHSIVSKVVEPDELGQVNGVLGTVDSLIPMVVFPLYSKLYQMTFQQWAGCFFLISACFASTTVLIFATVILVTRPSRKVHTEADLK